MLYMNIFLSGVNYKTTPLQFREILSFTNKEQKQILERIYKLKSVKECVMLSTCNRTEVYVYSEDNSFDNTAIEKVLCDFKGVDLCNLKKYFYVYSKVKAVKHLFKVACGLDSMVLGEDQILGQVKDAYKDALEARTSSSILNTLFRNAITAAKRIKTDTGLSKNSLSVSSLAVKLLDEIYEGHFEDKCVLVVGAGKMGLIALKNLCSRKVGKIYVTNRSSCKADDLSKSYLSVQSIDYNKRYSVIDECDVVISSTASPHYTITKDMIEECLVSKKSRIFLDLAVPRDIDGSITDIPGIKLFNIDHLESVMDKNIDKRIHEASKANSIIDKFISEYERWYEFRRVLPVIKDVQKYAEDVINQKTSLAVSKLKCTTEKDKEAVQASITNAVNEILNKFLYSVRENGRKKDIQIYYAYLEDAIRGCKK